MAFDDMHEIVHKAASAKGGRVKKTKGIGSLSPERRREIAAMGGKAKYANRDNQGAKQSKADRSDDSQRLADILGNLDE